MKVIVQTTSGFDVTLCEPVSYKGVTVPTGFKSDFASVPRIFWPFITPLSGGLRAPVVHDYIYTRKRSQFTRKQADELFLEIMQADGVGALKRYSMYFAVRVAGWYYWSGEK